MTPDQLTRAGYVPADKGWRKDVVALPDNRLLYTLTVTPDLRTMSFTRFLHAEQATAMGTVAWDGERDALWVEGIVRRMADSL